MKKFHCLCLAALFMVGCAGSHSADSNDSDELSQEEVAENLKEKEAARLESIRNDSIEHAEALQAEKEENDAKVEAFLRDYYDHYLLGNKDADKLKSHFSKSVLKRLKKIYDDEWGESGAEPGYAFYAMRGDSQDPSGMVIDFKPLEDNWYLVKFAESGNNYTIKIQANVENDKVIITNFKSPQWVK